MSTFAKYAEQGAYHWRAVPRGGFRSLDARAAGLYGAAVTELYSHLLQPASSRVVDLGAGDGALGWYLEGLGIASCAVDLDLHGLSLGRRALPDRPAVCADLLQLPFRDDYFGGAVMVEVIEHVLDDDKLLSEIARTLRPNAVLVLTTPLGDSRRKITDPYHVREYTPSELDSALSRHFDVEKIVGLISTSRADRYLSRKPHDRLLKQLDKLRARYGTNPFGIHLSPRWQSAYHLMAVARVSKA